jgi:diguanylate cyclase (GGDEF)-like protein
MGLLFLSGGVTSLLTLVLPHPATLNELLLLLLAITTPLVALALWLLRHRLPIRVYPWLLGVGTGIVTLLVATAGSTSAAVTFSFFYMWIVLYAVMFFSPLGVLLQVAVAAAAYGVALAQYGESGMNAPTAFEPVILTAVIGTTSAVLVGLSRAREASEVDPLTRAANRRGLDRFLGSALIDALSHQEPLIAAMVDVDHFKTLNDEHGHGVGDQVLVDLASAWKTLLRPNDFLARMGGDEFLIVLPGCAGGDASAILERLRTTAPTGVTCSFGAAWWRAGDSASMLVSNADAALYQAKRAGRNRVAWGKA